MKAKLSKLQQEVISLLEAGWEGGIDLYLWPSIKYKVRLQKDGLGKGGEAKYFKKTTVDALKAKGLITIEENNYQSVRPTRFYLRKQE